MKQLNYRTLHEIGYSQYLKEDAPEKVMQFGGGNFLRAFADAFFDAANEKADWNGKIAVIQPLPTGPDETINAQEGLYTLCLRGSENGRPADTRRVISVLSRSINPYTSDGFDAMLDLAASDTLEYIISNTTEAGIQYDPACQISDRPCSSFPGKLTQVLYHRYQSGKSGLVILSCELIDNNGQELLSCVNAYIRQWKLNDGFFDYVRRECLFCSTLVDRIVPGRIQNPEAAAAIDAENGYHDALLDVGEIFGIWNIEGPKTLENRLPFKAAGVPCTVVPDVAPYKKRKVRILNGAHTGFVPGAYLAGFDIVRDCMHSEILRGFMNKMLQTEILPILSLPKEELDAFAASVEDRFSNPFIDHQLLSISLNSTAKWKARNLPSLLDNLEAGHPLPLCLVTSFAMYLAFCTSNVRGLTSEGLVCRRADGTDYLCRDTPEVLSFFFSHHSDDAETLTRAVMENIDFWGRDLTEIPGFLTAAADALVKIREKGPLSVFASCL